MSCRNATRRTRAHCRERLAAARIKIVHRNRKWAGWECRSDERQAVVVVFVDGFAVDAAEGRR